MIIETQNIKEGGPRSLDSFAKAQQAAQVVELTFNRSIFKAF